jgi:hypothetical protein
VWYELHKQHLVELLRNGDDPQALGVTTSAALLPFPLYSKPLVLLETVITQVY